MSARSPERVSGLSNTHTRTHYARVSKQEAVIKRVADEQAQANMPVRKRGVGAHAAIYRGSGLVTVRRERAQRNEGGPAYGGGIRGEIRAYTPQVRERCQRYIARIHRNVVPCFLTLTYPDWWHPTPEEWCAHRRRFFERLRRRFPSAAAIWVREHHRDGRPHLHALVYGVDGEALRDWSPMAWYRSVSIDDARHERHLAAGTSVELARSARAVGTYVTKYVSKTGAQKGVTAPWGRWWGVHNEDALPIAKKPKMVEIPDSAARVVIRAFRKRYGFRRCYFKALTVDTETDDWSRWLRRIAVEERLRKRGRLRLDAHPARHPWP